MPKAAASQHGADIIAAAMAEVVEDSPELKNRVRALAEKALKWAEFDIDKGDPAARNNVIRALLPAMVKGAVASDDGERVKELEEQVAEMRAEMRSFFGSARTDQATPQPTVPEDEPPR